MISTQAKSQQKENYSQWNPSANSFPVIEENVVNVGKSSIAIHMGNMAMDTETFQVWPEYTIEYNGKKFSQ